MDDDGNRTLYFEVNDSTRAVKIHDKASKTIKETSLTKLADPKNKLEIGASIPGTIIKVLVELDKRLRRINWLP